MSDVILASDELLEMTRNGIEVWRSVVGSEGTYYVSNLGKVKSKRGEIKACPNSDGYPSVGVRQYGKRVYRTVHSLMCEAFIGPRPTTGGRWEIGNYDDNRTNNVLHNVRWCLESVNQADRRRNGIAFARASMVVDGVTLYQCTRCEKWLGRKSFRKLHSSNRSACGIASQCLNCSRIVDSERQRAKRLARGCKPRKRRLEVG